MSHIHKSKRVVPIYMFHDTSRYLGEIFILDNPEFQKYVPDIHVYQAKLCLNKVNALEKKLKVIVSNIHTTIHDKRDDFAFHIVKFSWFMLDVPIP